MAWGVHCIQASSLKQMCFLFSSTSLSVLVVTELNICLWKSNRQERKKKKEKRRGMQLWPFWHSDALFAYNFCHQLRLIRLSVRLSFLLCQREVSEEPLAEKQHTAGENETPWHAERSREGQRVCGMRMLCAQFNGLFPDTQGYENAHTCTPTHTHKCT